MSASEVYFARFSQKDSGRLDRFRKLLKAARVEKLFSQRDLVALKVHVGEAGCKTHMDPKLVAEVVKLAKAKKAIPFATDTAVLYRSERTNAIEHMALAEKHGFGIDGIGAPFFPTDGLVGAQQVIVPVKGKHYKEVAIAAGFFEATSIVVFSHLTGHLAAGMGATLKNLGMGFSSRKAKMSQHSTMSPAVKAKACTNCEECIEWCPEDAITNPDTVAIIDEGKCIGCGQCLAVCRFDAIKYNWAASSVDLQERMVEHALGVLNRKREKMVFVSLLVDITKDCDCMGDVGKPIIPDIGALCSTDPVAIDQAALDLVRQETGKSLGEHAYDKLEEDHQIKYAESLGLGSRQYNLVEI